MAPSTDTKPFRFLNLPGELRNKELQKQHAIIQEQLTKKVGELHVNGPYSRIRIDVEVVSTSSESFQAPLWAIIASSDREAWEGRALEENDEPSFVRGHFGYLISL
jgi:hypothetical protein